MQIIKINKKSEWEEVLNKISSVCFLQSWGWGEFQESLGSRVYRVVFTDKDTVLAAQYYIKKSRLFTYLYLPRGPVGDTSLLNKLLDSIKEVAKQNKVHFILIEPEQKEVGEKLTKFTTQPSMQPAATSIVSLSKNIESLQANLRKTTKQMIKKAQESNVKIKVYTDLSHWDVFARLFNDTTKRQGFNPHSLNYMKKQLQIFGEDGRAKLYIAELDDKAIAGAIIVSYHKTSIYLHAASSSEYRELGAAHLLLWTAIMDAKESGNQVFDLWGVAPDNQPHHPWAGISIFKHGFSGETVSYPSGFILPVNTVRYKLYRLISLLRKLPTFKTTQRALLSAITRG